ncbi:flagellin [Thauera aromatica]|uniref:flagellin N-terminal helical domain-containing protein n=1 Tax=Thauera aromatica TaxID=59405 RepID=UPI001FFD3540|nr:flagellin [Thauera aromatica]MCK2097262.1 hypothetical protein [Thauera aromatica]
MSVINTNITSLIGQSNLLKSQNSLTTAMERLSSGMRINSAKDDAAGQAIANRMSSQIKGLAQAQRNANDGISVAQTAEGALNQVNDNLQRIRELTVQAQNGTNSQDDLTSIQNEIGQRLTEINRISEETSFNGVKVLASEQGVSIQVGANDGQVIKVGLKEINASTLGLNGFNVNGSGETQNPKATVTSVLAAGGALGAVGGGEYDVVTTHEAATFDDVLGKMQDGNTVAISGGATYTYNAAAGNFTYTATEGVGVGSGAGVATALNMTPATGTKTGTYQVGGQTATFEITSTGAITLNGEAAFISADGELTNNSGAGAAAATIGLLVEETGATAAGRTLTVDGVTYTGDGSGDISYTATASASDVKTAMGNSVAGVDKITITVGDGFATKAITFAGQATTSSGANIAYMDGDDELTTVASFTTGYNINKDTGEVTVAGSTAAAGSKYAAEVGAVVYVSGGKLTTSETTPGTATEDPLAALDSALKTVDSLRSDLGAIQNRFESAITNLNTNETNLSAARSRIEDADYAKEVANMTRAQILQQAGTSVLAQANQVPQGVLSLLR